MFDVLYFLHCFAILHRFLEKKLLKCVNFMYNYVSKVGNNMIYASIDIGSDTIKMIVAEVLGERINVLASIDTRTVGIKKGIIIDKGLVVKSLTLALDEMEKQIGFRIDKAIITIPCYDAIVGVYNGEVYTDGIINGDSIINCFKSAIKGNIQDDREVITVFPIDFLVDDEDRYNDPKGVNGYKLESRILISTVPKELVYPYLEVLEECNVEVIDLALSAVCDFAQGMRDEFNKQTGAVVNIGDSKTEVAIFNKGLMIKNDILPIGSRKIDQDIKYIYNLDRTTARYLKENLAVATSQYADTSSIVEYESVDGEKRTVSQLEVSQIVEARLEEILKNVKKSLNSLTNREISYIIVTGGISNLAGFSYLLESTFGDTAYMINMNTMGVRNNIYSTCLGMIKYYVDKLALRGISYTMYENINDDKKNDAIYDNVLEKIQDYLDNN